MKKPTHCALCQHTKAQHLSDGGEGCWGGLWADCGCMRFDDGRPNSQEVAVEKARMEGLIEKDRGQQVALLTYEEWQHAFRMQVRVMAATGLPFTSEDVVEFVGLPSGDVAMNANNAVGAMMTALGRDKVITKTDKRVQSKRPSSHGAELAVWVGGWKK